MEEDKILYQLKQNTIYEDLYDEVTTWLVSLGNTSAQKHFAGVYMYNEIGVDYSKEGYCGITVKTPKGYDMLDYAIRVADKFGLNYRKTNTATRDVLIIYIKDRTKAVNMEFRQSDKNFRDNWQKIHKNDRTNFALNRKNRINRIKS